LIAGVENYFFCFLSRFMTDEEFLILKDSHENINLEYSILN